MTTDIKSIWPEIVERFEKSRKTSGFYSFATINPDGSPHIAPYASLVLNDDCSGYYSDAFPNQMARNLKTDQRICIMAVDFGMWYWFKGLLFGRFEKWPGIRLYGTVDKSRKARPGEVERWLARLKYYKRLKGYDLLWKDIRTVRDIHFTHFEPVRTGAMTRHLEAEQLS